MSGPHRLGSVLAEMHFWQAGTPDQRRRVAHATQVAAEIAASNREVVLAHPDLSARLAQLLGLSDPRKWTGYVPAEPDDDLVIRSIPRDSRDRRAADPERRARSVQRHTEQHRQVVDRRTQLVQLVAEARARAAGAP